MCERVAGKKGERHYSDELESSGIAPRFIRVVVLLVVIPRCKL